MWKLGETSEDVYVLQYKLELRWKHFIKQLTDVHEGQVG